VTSIDPPDGSAQAGYCATFWPIALSALLEMSTWGFVTVRSTLAAVANPSTTWRHAYSCPAELVNVIAVLPEHALDDYSANFGEQHHDWNAPQPDFANPAENMYMPQPYAVEQDGEGDSIILTNVCNAVLRYTIEASDPTKFSPLFVMALSYLLASMLAGPLLKGEAGATQSVAMLSKFQAFKIQATSSDANQRRTVVEQRVSWMAGR
jgi:hypothetical protein